jgi:hypothetical protein
MLTAKRRSLALFLHRHQDATAQARDKSVDYRREYSWTEM